MTRPLALACIVLTLLTTVGCIYRHKFEPTPLQLIDAQATVQEVLRAEGYEEIEERNSRSQRKGRLKATLAGADEEDPGTSARFRMRRGHEGYFEISMTVRSDSTERAQELGIPLAERIQERLVAVQAQREAEQPTENIPAVAVTNPPVSPEPTPTPEEPSKPVPATSDLPADSGKSYCLLIGVSEYQDGRFDALHAARSDVNRLARELEKKGVESDQMLILQDRDATRAEIIQELYTMTRKAKSGDTIIIYFAGHGRAPGAAQGAPRFVVPYDAEYDKAQGTAISTREIGDILDSSDAARQLVIMDCCFGGDVTRGKIEDDPFRPLSRDKGPKCRVVITSTKGNERAIDAMNGDANSPFAKALIRAMQSSEAAAEDGRLSAWELYEEVRDEVIEKSTSVSEMTPQLYGKKYAPQVFLPGSR